MIYRNALHIFLSVILSTFFQISRGEEGLEKKDQFNINLTVSWDRPTVREPIKYSISLEKDTFVFSSSTKWSNDLSYKCPLNESERYNIKAIISGEKTYISKAPVDAYNDYCFLSDTLEVDKQDNLVEYLLSLSPFYPEVNKKHFKRDTFNQPIPIANPYFERRDTVKWEVLEFFLLSWAQVKKVTIERSGRVTLDASGGFKTSYQIDLKILDHIIDLLSQSNPKGSCIYQYPTVSDGTTERLTLDGRTVFDFYGRPREFIPAYIALLECLQNLHVPAMLK